VMTSASGRRCVGIQLCEDDQSICFHIQRQFPKLLDGALA
jgi:hypothetical protein